MKKVLFVLGTTVLLSGCKKNQTGKIVISTNKIVNNEVLTVTVDGEEVGTLSEPTLLPECGDNNAITKTLPIGRHLIEATSSKQLKGWHITVDVESKACNTCIFD